MNRYRKHEPRRQITCVTLADPRLYDSYVSDLNDTQNQLGLKAALFPLLVTGSFGLFRCLKTGRAQWFTCTAVADRAGVVYALLDACEKPEGAPDVADLPLVHEPGPLHDPQRN